MVVPKKVRNFAAMKVKEEQYVITAVSRLTGERVEISGPMSREIAMGRLQREQEARGRQRYKAYTRLRVEKRLPVQLLFKFEDEY